MIFATAIICGVIVAAFILFAVYQKITNGVCRSNRRLDGLTALVTGGTSGIGLEVSKELAKRGAKLIIACPFVEEGLDAKQTIIRETGNDKVEFKHLDLESLKSVREFAAEVLKTQDRLDILVNNAGVGVPDRPETEDGLNFILQVNYYGHFLLTLLLSPLLKKAAPSRIVNSSSIMHNFGKIDRPISSGFWYRAGLYGDSKFLVIPFSRAFSNKFCNSGVTMNCADPGLVGGTTIFNSVPVFGRIISFFLKYLFKTVPEGAQTQIYLCVDETVAGISGELFKDCKMIRGISSAYGADVSSKLWDDSVRLVKLTEDELKECVN